MREVRFTSRIKTDSKNQLIENVTPRAFFLLHCLFLFRSLELQKQTFPYLHPLKAGVSTSLNQFYQNKRNV